MCAKSTRYLSKVPKAMRHSFVDTAVALYFNERYYLFASISKLIEVRFFELVWVLVEKWDGVFWKEERIHLSVDLQLHYPNQTGLSVSPPADDRSDGQIDEQQSHTISFSDEQGDCHSYPLSLLFLFLLSCTFTFLLDLIRFRSTYPPSSPFVNWKTQSPTRPKSSERKRRENFNILSSVLLSPIWTSLLSQWRWEQEMGNPPWNSLARRWRIRCIKCVRNTASMWLVCGYLVCMAWKSRDCLRTVAKRMWLE